MMKNRIGVSGCFVLALLLVCGLTDLYAQQPPAVFLPNDNSWVDPDDPRSFQNVQNRYADEINNSEWADLLLALAENFRQTATEWNDNREVYRLFAAELDSLVNEFRHAHRSGDDYYRSLNSIKTVRFNQGETGGVITYFKGQPADILLCSSVMSEESPCTDRPILSVEQAEDLRYRANTIELLLDRFKREPMTATVRQIETSHKKWSNFIDRGFTMYPWEAKLNSHLLTWSIKSPPEHQFIFLHPSLAVQASTGFFTDVHELKFRESLMVEVIGVMWYHGDHLEKYRGLSGTFVLRQDIPPGIGGNLHLGRGLSLGLNFHLSEVENKTFIKSPFLSVSLDLLGALKSNSAYGDLFH